jgi:chromosome segregation protein
MFKYINVGQGHLQLDKPAEPFNSGLFIKIRRNNKDYSLDALSGGEKTLVALMFIFALQFFKPSPFYILDEVDAALDKPNSKNLSDLVTKMAQDSQFILVSHNDIIMSNAETVIGVAKTEGSSKLVGINLKQAAMT